MKKMGTACAMVLLCAMLAASVAQAADVVCVEQNALGSEQAYSIMRATMDNGQVIHYLSRESEPRYRMEDVNFDGHEDFVPTTTIGASNFYSVFYVYSPQTGQYEPIDTGDAGFCNHTLLPDKGLVVSSENDGYLYRDIKIYQWQSGALTLLRRGIVKGLSTVEFDDVGMTERWDFGRSEMLVYDYTTGVENGECIYQAAHPQEAPQYEEHLAQFEERLWAGL